MERRSTLMLNNHCCGYRQIGWSLSALLLLYCSPAVAELSASDIARIIGTSRWEPRCTIDAMTDKERCSVNNLYAEMFIILDEKREPKYICVSGHNYAGKQAVIRVDKNKPFNTDETGCLESPDLLKQMIAGKIILSYRYKWPTEHPIDRYGELDSLSSALKKVKEIK